MPLKSDVDAHFRSRLSWQRYVALVLCATVAGVGAFVLIRANAPASTRSSGTRLPTPSGGRLGPDTNATLAQPFPVQGAHQVSLMDATSLFGSFGGTVVLPDTAQVAPSDAGAVWVNVLQSDTKADTQVAVRVTFPSRGLIVGYTLPPIPNALAYFQQNVDSAAGSQLAWMGSTPALYLPAASDGSYLGSFEFIAAGATIDVMGNTDEASLQAVAQSILDRATSAG